MSDKPSGVRLLERIQAHPQPDQDPGLTVSFSLGRPIPSGEQVVTVLVDKTYLGAQYLMLTRPELLTLARVLADYLWREAGPSFGGIPGAGVTL